MTISIVQIIISILIIVLILLQERSAGLGGIFGGGADGGGAYQTRRGFERVIFWGTIVSTAVFVALAVIQIII